MRKKNQSLALNLLICFQRCVTTLGPWVRALQFFKDIAIRGDGYRLAKSVAPKSTVSIRNHDALIRFCQTMPMSLYYKCVAVRQEVFLSSSLNIRFVQGTGG